MKQRLLQLLVKHSYIKGEVILASGKKSNFYIDCRKTALLAEGHHLIGTIFLKLIEKEFPQIEAVGGVVLGACPIASAISHYSFIKGNPIPAFYLRKGSKGHGMGKLLEGPVEKGAKVVIVEDVVTTGGSTLRALESARNEGLDVIGVVALMDRQENQGAEKIEKEVPFHAIFTKTDVINLA
jgi:orotate phosphoribosyltransferase